MNIVIVEDEFDAYKRLARLVGEVFEDSAIIAHLSSAQSATKWFRENAAPDLVFIDINLNDGTGFDVLNLVRIDCPLVFTTAYDEYAIEAFKTNSIAYLLKPVTKEDLEAVKQKIADFPGLFPTRNKPETPKAKKRFIIKVGGQIRMVSVEEIAYFYSQGGFTFLRTFDNRTLPIDYSLDVLHEILDPKLFFRISRRYLASLNSIDSMKIFNKSRIIITLIPPAQDQAVISAERSVEFKLWLADEL